MKLKVKNIAIVVSAIIATIVLAVSLDNKESPDNLKPIKEEVITDETISYDSSSDNSNTHTDSVTDVTYDCFKATGYTPSDEEIIMMCTVVSSEAGYCDNVTQKAVAHTIINRVMDDNFPDNIYDVVTQEGQYTAIHSYYDGCYREHLCPGSELWSRSLENCIEAMNEWDFTNGATAYYNPSVNGYDEWFETLHFVYANENGRFFKMHD